MLHFDGLKKAWYGTDNTYSSTKKLGLYSSHTIWANYSAVETLSTRAAAGYLGALWQGGYRRHAVSEIDATRACAIANSAAVILFGNALFSFIFFYSRSKPYGNAILLYSIFLCLTHMDVSLSRKFCSLLKLIMISGDQWLILISFCTRMHRNQAKEHADNHTEGNLFWTDFPTILDRAPVHASAVIKTQSLRNIFFYVMGLTLLHRLWALVCSSQVYMEFSLTASEMQSPS